MEPSTAGLLGSAAGAAGGVISTLLTNRANRKLAQYSYDQQRQMIAEQNAYNSPVQQMARYAEAGLNPHLIYGSGQASAGNQSGIARYDAPTMQAPDVSASIGHALQMALSYRQAAADIALKEEQAYSQRMLGLGYQQDYYQKQIETAVKSMQAGLRTPAGVWSQDDLEQIRNGNRLRHYNLEVSGMEIQQALQRVQADVQRLNAREKQFVIDNILPVEQRIMELKEQGMSTDNVIKTIQSEFLEAEKRIGLGSQAGTILATIVRIFAGHR